MLSIAIRYLGPLAAVVLLAAVPASAEAEAAGVSAEGGFTLLNGAIAAVTLAATGYNAWADRRQKRDEDLYGRLERQVGILDERLTRSERERKELERDLAGAKVETARCEAGRAEQGRRIGELQATVERLEAQVEELVGRLAHALMQRKG